METQNARRPLILGVPYFLPIDIALTATAGENVRGASAANYNLDLTILGGITDLETSQVRFAIEGSRQGDPMLWSEDYVPLRSLLGVLDSARPVLKWPKPFPLLKGRRVEAKVLNVAGEGAGTIILTCGQPSTTPLPRIADVHLLGQTLVLSVDSQFTNTASETKSIDTTPRDFDFVMYGFYTNLANAKIQIVDVERREWMPDYVPIWAIAGRATAQLAVQYLDRPYLIPAQQSMKFKFQNHATAPEASGQLFIFGQRLQ